MIIVTGGAGFIGSNLVRALLAAGYDDVVVVDDLSDGTKFRNLVDLAINDYWDKDDFYARLVDGLALDRQPNAIFHQGACSDTMEWNGRKMLQSNFDYSKVLLHYCIRHRVPIIYASGASVYGEDTRFVETPECERPLNVYGYSKLLFDQYVRRVLPKAASQIVGLRYFSVYGPREQHKGRMASIVWHLHEQLERAGRLCLFEGCDGYADGEQRRDFVHVDDAVAVNLWCLRHPEVSGIFNVGTGHSRSFNEVARAVAACHGEGEIEYIPFPDALKGRYQSFTEADIGALRGAGFDGDFLSVEQGVRRYLDALRQARPSAARQPQ